MYQLHQQYESERSSIEIYVESCYQSEGGTRGTTFQQMWKNLLHFLEKLPNVFLILDGLDECQDSNLLVPRLLELSIPQK